jgi:hypothetical protein
MKIDLDRAIAAIDKDNILPDWVRKVVENNLRELAPGADDKEPAATPKPKKETVIAL